MKVFNIIACTLVALAVRKTAGSAIGAPFYPLDPDDLTEGDIQELEYWDKYYHRQKRLAAPRLASAGLAVNIRTATVDGFEKKIVEIAPNSIPTTLKPLPSHETIPIDSPPPQSSSPSKRGVHPTNFLFSGSASAFKHLKTAFFTGIVSKIASGSAAASGAASSAANSLKNVFISKVASGSAAASGGAVKHALTASGAAKLAKVASGSAKASTGFQTKVEQVSDDIAVSEADVKTQLRTAIEAGNDQNLGQAASGLAGAVAGAVGSASAGAGQLTRGVIEESTNLLNQAKLEILHENVIDEGSDKVARRVRRSPAPFGHGSAGGVHQVKATIISALVNAVGQITGASARTLTGASSQTVVGSAAGIHHLTKALFAKITGGVGHLATASVAGSSGAVAHASNAANGLKTAAFGHIGNTVAKIAQGSVAASGQLAAGSAGAINQAKSAVFSKVTGTIGQLATAAVAASSGASAQASSVANGLKEAAVSQLTNQIGLASKGAVSAVSGSGAAIHQLKSAVVSHLGNTVAKAAQGSAAASGYLTAASAGTLDQVKNAALSHVGNTVAKVAQGSASAVAGTSASLSGAAKNLKAGAISHVTNKIGQLAAGSASLATGASSGVAQASAGAVNAVKQLKTSAVSHAASASAAASGAITKGIGSASSAIHQAKVGALTQVHRKLRQVASDVTKTSHGALNGVGNTISGSAKAVYDLKEAAVNVVQNQISKAAEASAEASGRRRKRSSSGSSSIFGHLTDEEEEEDLPKRSETTGSGSGSGDILNHFKSALISGLGQKIGQVAKGSAGAVAGASAGFSKGSSGADSHPSYHHETDEEEKGLDVWDLKKSVLNTLLQAVKAIKGGVLAIKGQLIKGSGYVVSGSGKLLASGGDKVTKLGKNIINNAVLVHPDQNHHHHHAHSEYSSHSSYTAPDAPPVGLYDVPLSTGHGHSSNYESPSLDHHHIKPYGTHAGILILRRVPHADKYKSSYSHHHIDHATAPPSFKPLPPTGPTFGTVVGKFFTASTSLDPRQPTAFTDADIHPYEHYYREQHKEVEESHSNFSPPDPPHFDHSGADGSLFEHRSPTGPGSVDHLHGEASSISEEKVKLTKGELSERLPAAPTLASSQVEVPKDAPESLQALQLSHGAANDHTLGPPFNSDYMSKKVHQNFVTPEKPIEPQESEHFANFLPKSDDALSSHDDASNELSTNSKESYMRFVEQFPFPRAHPTVPSSPRQTSRRVRVVRRPAPSSYRTKGPAYRPDFSVVKSVSYEITPDGAKRLT